jgi:acetyltransferase-like isoleucine patch superfamily enzyme
MLQVFGRFVLLLDGIFRRIRRVLVKPLFKECGVSCSFSPSDTFSFARISLGNRVFIGQGAHISTATEVSIGDDVMIGPGLVIMGGDHNTALEGLPMSQVRDKRPGDDVPIVVERDVWIGARVTVLKGVRIGRGAVVAAGSVVTRNVDPYSVVAGVPARLLRWRGTEEEIAAHDRRVTQWYELQHTRTST